MPSGEDTDSAPKGLALAMYPPSGGHLVDNGVVDPTGINDVAVELRNDGESPVQNVTIWVRLPIGPLIVKTADVVAPGAGVVGIEIFDRPVEILPESVYATLEHGGVLWRVDVDGTTSLVVKRELPASIGLPDQLPGDIGRRLYFNHFGQFRPRDEMSVDVLEPRSDYVERQEERRSRIAAQLHTVDRCHFLFGEPGVLAEPGRFLYHYTRTDALEKIAETRSLRLSAFSTKNDPRESRRWAGLGVITRNAGGRAIDDDDTTAAQQFTNDVEDLRQRALLISFGQDRHAIETDEVAAWSYIPPRGYMQPRMWAQYGDGHQGACLIIDRLRFAEAAERSLNPIGDLRCGNVNYTNDAQELRGLVGYWDAGATNDPRERLLEVAESQLLAKDPDWSSENEFRWICIPTEPDVAEALVPLADSVVGVVHGDLVDEQGLTAVAAFAEAFEIEMNVAQCDWSHPLQYGATWVQPG